MKDQFYLFRVYKINPLINIQLEQLIDFLADNLKISNSKDTEEACMGFRLIDNVLFPKYILEDLEYKEFSQNLIIIEYFWRKFTYKKVLNYQNLTFKPKKEKIISDILRGYIFIIFPDILIFKGSEEASKAVWDDFLILIAQIINIQDYYIIDHEFLLKLLEKLSMRRNMLEDDFSVKFIVDLSFEREKKYMSESSVVKRSYLVLKSNPVLIAFLECNHPKNCIFDFSLKSIYITVEININGPLTIKQQKGHFINFTHNERAFHGCFIIYRLIKFYEKWKLLNPRDRYITIQFIKSIIDYLKKQGINALEKAIKKVVKYGYLRGELPIKKGLNLKRE